MNQTFALVATGALMSVFLMMHSKNPVHSVFYLVLQFLHCSGLQVLLGLEYFVQLQQLVYVGALAIQFLFVVMLLDIPATEIQAHQRGTYPVAGVQTLCLVRAGALALWQPENALETSPLAMVQQKSQESYYFWTHENTSPVVNLGIALYGVHADLQILASLLLLVAMVGAVGLTLKRPVTAPQHDVFAQHSVDFQKIVMQIPSDKTLSLKNLFSIFFFLFL